MKITGVPSRIKKETARPPSPPCVSFSSALFLSLLVSLQMLKNGNCDCNEQQLFSLFLLCGDALPLGFT